MTERAGGMTCDETHLGLVAATGQVGYRVAVSSRGPLTVHPRTVTPTGRVEYDPDGHDIVVPWDQQPAWSRWDAEGRTLYVAATRRAAFAEVLQHQRQTGDSAHLGRLAEAAGMSLAEFLAALDREAETISMMPRGQISAGWRHARVMHRVSLPASGWWVDIEDGDTLSVLTTELQRRVASIGHSGPIERAHVLGNDRRLTLLIAAHIRALTLFDGSRPLGIRWGSKLGYGHNYALWLRQTDDGATPAADGVAADGGTPLDLRDPDLAHVARAFQIRLH